MASEETFWRRIRTPRRLAILALYVVSLASFGIGLAPTLGGHRITWEWFVGLAAFFLGFELWGWDARHTPARAKGRDGRIPPSAT